MTAPSFHEPYERQAKAPTKQNFRAHEIVPQTQCTTILELYTQQSSGKQQDNKKAITNQLRPYVGALYYRSTYDPLFTHGSPMRASSKSTCATLTRWQVIHSIIRALSGEFSFKDLLIAHFRPSMPPVRRNDDGNQHQNGGQRAHPYTDQRHDRGYQQAPAHQNPAQHHRRLLFCFWDERFVAPLWYFYQEYHYAIAIQNPMSGQIMGWTVTIDQVVSVWE